MASIFSRPLLFLTLVALLATSSLASQCRICESARYEHKNRVFVLTDMSNEPDDQMSLVRFLTYANELNIQGIAATTSTWMRTSVDPETIREVIRGYGSVVKNLNANVLSTAPYPSAEHLLDKVSEAHPVYGLMALNLSMSGAATALIKATDASTVDNPLWVSIWGGAAVLAEALQHVSQTRDTNAAEAFVGKLRVYSISDQDDAGVWIRDQYPMLFYIVSLHAWSHYTQPTWIGISGEELRHFDDGGPDSSLVSNDWLQEHIRVGPLGAHYLNWTFIMEGDTPSFLSLVQNGLGDIENPQWGSWGGRYALLDTSGRYRVYTDCADYVQGLDEKAYSSKYATIWRWREAYQYDFAARMQWTVEGEFANNNHQPIAVVNGSCGPSAHKIPYTFGDRIILDASNSWDPDGDELLFSWFHYRESSGRELEGFDLPITSEDLEILSVDTSGSVVNVEPQRNQTMHLILSVHDDQKMPLVSYRRIILQPQ